MLNLRDTVEISREYNSSTNKQDISSVYIHSNVHNEIFIYDPKILRNLPIGEKYSPKPGDVLYIGVGCNIPRVKLRDLLLNNYATTTNDITKATHIFIDVSFQKMIDTMWLNLVSKQQLLQFNELALANSLINTEEHDIIVDLLKDYPDDKSINIDSNLDYEINQQRSSIYLPYKNVAKLTNTNSDKINRGDIVNSDHVEDWKYIHNNIDKVYNYKALIGHINAEDSITITEEVFQQLSSMFESEDTDNHVLAMEIMANSNYYDSLMYLEILFVDHGDKMNASNTKRHVNFKSLTDYLNKNTNYLGSSSSYSIIDTLIDKKAVTLEAVKYVFNKYKEDYYSGSAHFHVKQITLSDELAKLLNVNYIQTIKEDYIPEVIEEQEEEEQEQVKSEEFNWAE